jgi:regulation of enolase protein 1 (concanavalin A-like superfamily)
MLQWFNEAPKWEHKEDRIVITTAPKSDFWRKTHYGFIRDNGHFYYQPVTGDFTVDVKVSGQYNCLYDQAGLMVRVDESCWLKCGIEYVDGVQNVSAVVTRDFSDWSILPLPDNPASLWLRLVRRKEAVEILYSLDGENYRMYRLTHLTLTETVNVGLMCATPDGEGFTVTFEGYKVQPL